MNHSMLRLALSALGTLTAALALGGCPPCGSAGPYSVASWGFEECTDSTCGFTVESGAARRASLFHPGEHGLDLAGSTSVKGLISGAPANPYGAPSASLIARCDAGTTLTISLQVSVSESSGASSAAPGAPRQERDAWLTSPASVGSTWSRTTVFLPSPESVSRILAARVTTEGTGHCQIDEFEVSQNGLGFCE